MNAARTSNPPEYKSSISVKYWTRRLVGVDKNFTNGYAFVGEFVRLNRANNWTHGDHVLQFDLYPESIGGAVKVNVRVLTYDEPNNKWILGYECCGLDNAGWAVHVIDPIHQFVGTAVQDPNVVKKRRRNPAWGTPIEAEPPKPQQMKSSEPTAQTVQLHLSDVSTEDLVIELLGRNIDIGEIEALIE